MLFEEAHKRGIRVLLDLVPGHTSDKHKWFRASRRPDRNKYSDRYIWTNDVFDYPEGFRLQSGLSDRNGNYVVNFFSSQPALNYGFERQDYPWQLPPDHPACVATLEEMKNVMRFWLDMGCDGFRVDMAYSLVKNDENRTGIKRLWQNVRRTGIYLDAIAEAKKLITDRPVFAGVIGPFSLAGRLVDVTEAMILCFEDPDMLKTVLEKCTQFLVDYIKKYKEVGADGVVIAEPLAGLLSPDLAAEFSHPYIKRIVDACQDENFIIVYHNCGNGTIRMLDGIVGTGCKAYHFGNAIDMRDLMPHMPSDCIAMGNIDPAGEFLNGTEQSVYDVTSALLRDCGKYPNFVLSSGCDIPPRTPWKNIDAFFRAAKDYYRD